jgi:hypothetical protein
LSSEVFGRQTRFADSLEPCGFARPGRPCRGTRSALVMKGSPVRVRASASSRFPARPGRFASALASLTAVLRAARAVQHCSTRIQALSDAPGNREDCEVTKLARSRLDSDRSQTPLAREVPTGHSPTPHRRIIGRGDGRGNLSVAPAVSTPATAAFGCRIGWHRDNGWTEPPGRLSQLWLLRSHSLCRALRAQRTTEAAIGSGTAISRRRTAPTTFTTRVADQYAARGYSCG